VWAWRAWRAPPRLACLDGTSRQARAHTGTRKHTQAHAGTCRHIQRRPGAWAWPFMPRASRARMAWPLSKVVFGLMRLISADQACGCRALAAQSPVAGAVGPGCGSLAQAMLQCDRAFEAGRWSVTTGAAVVFGEWARGRAVSGAWLAVGPEGGRRTGCRRRRRSRCDEGVVHVHSLKVRVRVRVRVRIWAWAWARVRMAESARPSEPCLVNARSGRVASARDRSRVADRGRWQAASWPSGHGRPLRPWHARHGPRSVPACHGVEQACRRSGRTRSWPHEQLPGPAGTRRGRCVGPRHPSPRACSRAFSCVRVRAGAYGCVRVRLGAFAYAQVGTHGV
jgi:hypothetical protein